VRLDAGGVLQVGATHEGDVAAVVHPRAVSLFPAPPAGSPRNGWAATVASTAPFGGRVRVRLDAEIPIVAEVTSGAATELAIAPGRSLWVSLKATEIETIEV
jgi:molybdate transport system ATP-binding protein